MITGRALPMGFSKQSGGYRILDLFIRKIIEKRDVRFHEGTTVHRNYGGMLLRKVYRNEGNLVLLKEIRFVRLPIMNVVDPGIPVTEAVDEEATRASSI